MLCYENINKILWIIDSIFISITAQANQLSKSTETDALVGVTHTRAVIKRTNLFLVHPDKFRFCGLQVCEEHVVFVSQEQDHISWEQVWQVRNEVESV